MAGQLRVNSALYSWTSCIFKVDNLPTAPDGTPWDIVSLDFEEKRERKVVYSNRQDGRPRGKTSGKYSVPSVTMKMLTAQHMKLLQYLALSTGTPSYGDAEFGILVQVAEPVIGAQPITYSLKQVTIDDIKDGHEEGIDELVTEFELGVLNMSRNGLTLWSAIRGLPGNL